jgi:hypothetical protein
MNFYTDPADLGARGHHFSVVETLRPDDDPYKYRSFLMALPGETIAFSMYGVNLDEDFLQLNSNDHPSLCPPDVTAANMDNDIICPDLAPGAADPFLAVKFAEIGFSDLKHFVVPQTGYATNYCFVSKGNLCISSKMKYLVTVNPPCPTECVSRPNDIGIDVTFKVRPPKSGSSTQGAYVNYWGETLPDDYEEDLTFQRNAVVGPGDDVKFDVYDLRYPSTDKFFVDCNATGGLV